MRLALLCDDPAVVPWLDAMAGGSVHEVVVAATVSPRASELLRGRAGIRLTGQWEELLIARDIDAVLVGGSEPSLLEAVKQLATAGQPILFLPQAAQGSTFLYELSLIRDDNRVKLFPALVHRRDQALVRLREVLRAGSLGKVQLIQFEREVSGPLTTGPLPQAVVDAALLPDIDLLRWLGGDYDQITALRTGAGNDAVLITGLGPVGLAAGALCRKLGAADAASHFIAVTDPGSRLEATAQREGFRRVFHGEPQIGGRYSALSNFGMVPAAVIGIDVAAFIGASELMARSCGPSVPPAVNPGILLGLVLGAAAKAGRDKLSIVASKGIADLGAWLEQLIAESTGKLGKGLIPVDAEPLGAPGAYGGDRLFVYLRLDDDATFDVDAAVREFEDDGHPVIRITLANRDTLGQEFFRWEMATAVAGAVIGLNPFDQPDVEASKLKTRALTDSYEQTGRLPSEEPILRSEGLTLYADPSNADALQQAAGARSLDAVLDAHFERAHKGDYIGLLAYLDRSPAHISALQHIRKTLRDRKKVATVLGFGPRFQHSTGQAYKGGPNSGVFLQITAEPAADLPVPGHSYSFGVVEAAQARGDFDVLAECGRRLLRLDLGRDVEGGLKRLAEALDRSLA